jgi:hypothetical protein
MRLSLIMLSVGVAALTAPVQAQNLSEAQLQAEAMAKDPDFHALAFKPGDTGRMHQDFVVTTTKTDEDGKTTTVKIDSGYDLTYTKNDDGYDVTKTSNGGKLLAFDSPDAPSGSPQAALIAGMASMGSLPSSLNYQADDDMLPVRLSDWPGFKANLLQKMRDLYVKAGAPQSAIDPVMQASALAMDQFSAETAPRAFMAGDVLISTPHNIGLILNKPLVANGQVASPIGNVMLDATDKLELTVWDAANNHAHVTYDFAPTPEGMKNFLLNGMPSFLKQMGAPDDVIEDYKTSAAAASPETLMDVSTHCDFDVAIDTGFVSKGTCVKAATVTLAGHKAGKVETYELSEAKAGS